MAGTISGRRYTTAELDELERAQSSDQFQAPENVSAPPQEVPLKDFGQQVWGGAKTSLKRTYLGAKQLGTYALGDDADRERVNQEIQQLEEESAPTMDTAGGKLGDFLGTTAQFVVPGKIAEVVGRTMPAVTNAVRVITGVPGSTQRAALTSALFSAVQPTSPSDQGNESFLMPKLGNVAMNMGVGSVSGKAANILTKPYLLVDPERAALAQEAERLGMKLTPAQLTGDRTLQQYEEGLASRPGSGKVIHTVRETQRKMLDRKAAEALGMAAEAPNEAVLAMARENASKGYAPISKLAHIGTDDTYLKNLQDFVLTQPRLPATGSREASTVAEGLLKESDKMDGHAFLQELQGVRDLATKARRNNDAASARQFSDLATMMEDRLERRVLFAAPDEVPPDAVEQLKKARTDYAKIHAIERATEPVSGRVSPQKYLNQEFQRKPASKGRGTSPLETGLRDVGDTARVLRQTLPYIGSSGTAERMGGQQMVDMSTGTLSAIKGAVPLAKNYLAAKYYLAHGGQPGYLAKYLSPDMNMLARRLIPEEVMAAKQAVND